MLIAVVARSKAWACGISCWDCELEYRRGHVCLSVVSVVCQVEVSASVWSLVQRSPIECGDSECDHESWIKRRPCPTGGCAMVKKYILKYLDLI